MFPNNLPIGMSCNPYYGCAAAAPSSTANTRVLIATQGFADLHLITPDYVIPNGFLATDGGTINYAGVDQVTYGALPTDGTTAINRSGAMIPNMATNFSGAIGLGGGDGGDRAQLSGTVVGRPAESESGWGINFAHQGDAIFATWFTYDATGKAWWLTMTANLTAPGVYSGQLIRTNGAPFSAFVPPATQPSVGTGTLTFTSATTGTSTTRSNDGANVATQTKSIVAADLRSGADVCVGRAAESGAGDQLSGPVVGAPAGAESGLGREPDASGDDHLRDLVHLRRQSQPAVAVRDAGADRAEDV